MTVTGILSGSIDLVRGEVAPMLAKCADDPDRLLDECGETRRQCWVALDRGEIRAVALTQVTPDGVCEVTHMVGQDMREWLDGFTVIEKWAKAQGCHAVDCIGRPGWERVAAPYGYKKTRVIIRKAI